jgi:hypothetical protein
MKKNPVMKQPVAAPRVFRPYRRLRKDPSLWSPSGKKRVKKGRVAPIRKVGGRRTAKERRKRSSIGPRFWLSRTPIGPRSFKAPWKIHRTPQPQIPTPASKSA